MTLAEIKQRIVNTIEKYHQARETAKKEALVKNIDELHDLMETQAFAQGVQPDLDEEIQSLKGAISEIKKTRREMLFQPVKKELGLIGGTLKTGYKFVFPDMPPRQPVTHSEPTYAESKGMSQKQILEEMAVRKGLQQAQPEMIQPAMIPPRKKRLSSMEILQQSALQNQESARPRRKSSSDILREMAMANTGKRKPSTKEILEQMASERRRKKK